MEKTLRIVKPQRPSPPGGAGAARPARQNRLCSKLLPLLLAGLMAGAMIGYLLPAHVFGLQQQVSYLSVHVAPGDTVWLIAARHTAAHEDIREMIFAIRQANNLNNNAEIYPGQVLQIPVTRPPAGETRSFTALH